MGTLYLVATPIGNLEDITLRALRILRTVHLIAAEDTRRARILLHHYDITTPVVSYFEHSRPARVDAILAALEAGNVAVISEAGMPGINDPGFTLVREAIQRGIPVVPIPGPSAPIAALAASGLPTDRFHYLGFLPRRPGDRRRVLAEVAAIPATLICLEAPHRLAKTLEDILAILGDRPMVIGRELTKIHEEFLRGPVSQMVAHFQQWAPRGEFVLLIEGAREEARSGNVEDGVALVRQLEEAGYPRGEAVRLAAQRLGLPRRALYQRVIARTGL
jgi:16S rRNA (cytidine1402-2'-O)-methyltransferase